MDESNKVILILIFLAVNIEINVVINISMALKIFRITNIERFAISRIRDVNGICLGRLFVRIS